MDNVTKKAKDKYEGTLHVSNNSGTFKVIEYIDYRHIKVRFISTGYEQVTTFYQIKTGAVKDKLKPTLLGIGYLGVGPFKGGCNNKHTPAYLCWKGMIARCYCEKSLKKRPTYRECSVVEEWHNFQNFAKWYEDNYVEGYDLDKDIKVEGNKVYGPETCIFVSPEENGIKCAAKNYKVINPEGKVVAVYNMLKFCIDNNLSYSSMRRLAKGLIKQYKGWTKYE